MAKYVCGNGAKLFVLTMSDEPEGCEAEFTLYSVDYKNHDVAVKRTPVSVQHGDEPVLRWNGVDHAFTRSTYADEKGDERAFIRVKGFGTDERGQLFSLFPDDEVSRSIENLEYTACLSGRNEAGLPLGPHLEPRFQDIYYGLSGASYVLSLILHDLSTNNSALWEKYREEPFGAVWETKNESEDLMPTTIVARDGSAVIFYDSWDEAFRFGTLTTDKDQHDNLIVQPRERDDSELAALQLALDRLWNPGHYPHE